MFQWRHALLALGVLGLICLSVPLIPLIGREKDEKPAGGASPGSKSTDTDKSTALAEVRKMSEAYARAFNKADAKALAATWLGDGEYFGPDGTTIKGKKAIEKAYADFFKNNPKVKLDVEIESLRQLGRNTALEEGLLRLTRPDQDEPEVTRYSAIFVREGGKWLTSVVRESDVDATELLSLNSLAWLVGFWQAKSETIELTAHYEWAENKTFLLNHFEMKERGKVILKGTQRIGRDASAGVLRCWQFDTTGGFGESVWQRDGNRWVLEASGTLPDGSKATAKNVIIPKGSDQFSFQSTERTLNGSEMPDLPPVKVTRVKK